MTSSRRLLRIAAVSTGLFVALVLAMGTAAAAVRDRASQDVLTTTGSWGAVPAATGATATPGSSYTINWTSIAVQYQFFKVVNTGTLGLTSQTYTAANSQPANGNALPTIAIDACVGAVWNATTATCTGTVVRVTTTTQGATAATISIPVGAMLSLRASPIALPANLQPFATTISVSVSRAQSRPPGTSDS